MNYLLFSLPGWSNFFPHSNRCKWTAIVSSLQADISSRTKGYSMRLIKISFTDRRFYVVYGEERCFKMCALPLASAGTSPTAACLNWVQNDNERSEQPAVPQCSGEWSKSYSGLLGDTNWNSKSLCHLSLKARLGKEGVGIRRLAVIPSLQRRWDE